MVVDRASLFADLVALMEHHGVALESVAVNIAAAVPDTDAKGYVRDGPAAVPVAISVQGWAS